MSINTVEDRIAVLVFCDFPLMVGLCSIFIRPGATSSNHLSLDSTSGFGHGF